MIITIENLRRGMEDWVSRLGWTSDFEAPLYPCLATLRSGGLSQEWWSRIVDHLARWRATRPQSKAAILEKGSPQLASLAQELGVIVESSRPQSPNLDTCDWQQVAGLYGVAHSIKGSCTPVFGSKLCHFILPDAFPVIDWDFTGVPSSSYRSYWQFCQEQWSSCQDRQPLVDALLACIRSEDADAFPWTTKITELCIAGSRAV